MDIAHFHFLVAESDPGERVALLAVLGHLGASELSEVPDGQSALNRFNDALDAPIDIAVIDLALDGMDGLTLVRRLAALDCHAGVIVIAAQTKALLFSVETMAQAYGIELLGTIAKPVTEQKLEALIANYTPFERDSRRAEGPSFSFAEVGAGLQAGQFEPFFQPKIELATGHVTGLETFARWRHPQYGLLGPAAFIDALEQNSRIDFLDWSMIERAVAACRGFHDLGIAISISVNLAPATLGHPSFITQMSACMARHRILPQFVTFEMPESAVLTTDPHFLERLLRLRMAGYGLAIDDYGTGSSNLQLLARIPFSELKIDRSFVDGASKRRGLGTVLSSCLGLARSLDRTSVAVGVETKQDWDFLQGLGCTYAQGYHIAKPMEADAFPDWLYDWQQFF